MEETPDLLWYQTDSKHKTPVYHHIFPFQPFTVT